MRVRFDTISKDDDYVLDYVSDEEDDDYGWIIGTVHYELDNTNATLEVQAGPISNLNKPVVIIETIGQLRARLLQ